jgi:hypothetical protein
MRPTEFSACNQHFGLPASSWAASSTHCHDHVRHCTAELKGILMSSSPSTPASPEVAEACRTIGSGQHSYNYEALLLLITTLCCVPSVFNTERNKKKVFFLDSNWTLCFGAIDTFSFSTSIVCTSSYLKQYTSNVLYKRAGQPKRAGQHRQMQPTLSLYYNATTTQHTTILY